MFCGVSNDFFKIAFKDIASGKLVARVADIFLFEKKNISNALLQ